MVKMTYPEGKERLGAVGNKKLENAVRQALARLRKGWGRLDEWEVGEIVRQLERGLDEE